MVTCSLEGKFGFLVFKSAKLQTLFKMQKRKRKQAIKQAIKQASMTNCITQVPLYRLVVSPSQIAVLVPLPQVVVGAYQHSNARKATQRPLQVDPVPTGSSNHVSSPLRSLQFSSASLFLIFLNNLLLQVPVRIVHTTTRVLRAHLILSVGGARRVESVSWAIRLPAPLSHAQTGNMLPVCIIFTSYFLVLISRRLCG